MARPSLPLLLAALLLAGLGACADDSGSPASGGHVSADATTKKNTASVPEAGVAFEVPKGWTEFDRDKMQKMLDDNAALDELNDRAGVGKDQFQQMLASNIMLFVTAPQAKNGFLSNINVGLFDTKLPKLGDIEQQYRSIGATDISTDPVTTPVGKGYDTTYSLAMAGLEVHGRALSLQVDGKVVAITVSSGKAKEADQVASAILDSLAAA